MRAKRPAFWFFDGLEEERDAARTLDRNLLALDGFVADFEAALALFNKAGTVILTSPVAQASL